VHTRYKLVLSLTLLAIVAAQASAGLGSFFGPPPYGDAYRDWKASRHQPNCPAGGEMYTGVAAPGMPAPGTSGPPSRPTIAVFEVRVPANAEVWIDDHKGQQTGPRRIFNTPDLPSGRTSQYTIRARWMKDNLPVEETRQLAVEPGSRILIDFTQP
jgi:uncharacterized protein (TIGR03000 family)